MKQNFIIPLVVYPFDVMISLGETDEELNQSLGVFNFIWDNKIKKSVGKCIMTESNHCLIRLWNYPETNEDYGTLAHEIFHAVTNILDVIGMKLHLFKSDEAYAYLMGYLTTEIYNKMK